MPRNIPVTNACAWKSSCVSFRHAPFIISTWCRVESSALFVVVGTATDRKQKSVRKLMGLARSQARRYGREQNERRNLLTT